MSEIDKALNALRAAHRMMIELQRSPDERRRRAEATGSARPQKRDLRYSGMTVAEAADALGIGEEQVRRLLRRGELVGVPYGGRTGWRLPRDEVTAIAAQLAAAREGQDAARRRLMAGSLPGSPGSRKRRGGRRRS